MHAQDKAGEAKQEGKGYLQTAQEKAGQLFGQTQDQASQAKGETKDNLNSAADKASDKADQAHKEGKGMQQSAPHLCALGFAQGSSQMGGGASPWVPRWCHLLNALSIEQLSAFNKAMWFSASTEYPCDHYVSVRREVYDHVLESHAYLAMQACWALPMTLLLTRRTLL